MTPAEIHPNYKTKHYVFPLTLCATAQDLSYLRLLPPPNTADGTGFVFVVLISVKNYILSFQKQNRIAIVKLLNRE